MGAGRCHFACGEDGQSRKHGDNMGSATKSCGVALFFFFIAVLPFPFWPLHSSGTVEWLKKHGFIGIPGFSPEGIPAWGHEFVTD